MGWMTPCWAMLSASSRSLEGSMFSLMGRSGSSISSRARSWYGFGVIGFFGLWFEEFDQVQGCDR